jgi:Rab5 GDP/GTP exchange factor
MSSPHEALNSGTSPASNQPIPTEPAVRNQQQQHGAEQAHTNPVDFVAPLEQPKNHTQDDQEPVAVPPGDETPGEKQAGAKEDLAIKQASTPRHDVDADGTGRAPVELEASSHPEEKLSSLGLGNDTGDKPAAEKPRVAEDPSAEPPPPPPKDEKYLASPRPNESGLSDKDPEKEALQKEEMDFDSNGNGEAQVEEVVDDSRSEIQSIMDQFQDGMGGPGEDEIMSPRLEKAGPLLGSAGQHPPRKSSLEPISSSTLASSVGGDSRKAGTALHSPPPRTSSLISVSSTASLRRQSLSNEPPESPLSTQSTRHLPPPPQPDPEPDLPFDFHRFLEQLRHRTADPVAKFLRSFLVEFGKKQWMVHEQVKIISDFLEFITKKMAQCEVWRTVSDAEFDNAREGMEKLVMNRLYTQTFSPAIPSPEPAGPKGKRRTGQGPATPTKPGRRGQHQEDVERDEVLAQKVRIYGWVREEHLDIKPIGEKGRKFMTLAQQGLSKHHKCFTGFLPDSSRAAEDQKLSSTTRQGDMYIELLQGHLR